MGLLHRSRRASFVPCTALMAGIALSRDAFPSRVRSILASRLLSQSDLRILVLSDGACIWDPPISREAWEDHNPYPDNSFSPTSALGSQTPPHGPRQPGGVARSRSTRSPGALLGDKRESRLHLAVRLRVLTSRQRFHNRLRPTSRNPSPPGFPSGYP